MRMRKLTCKTWGEGGGATIVNHNKKPPMGGETGGGLHRVVTSLVVWGRCGGGGRVKDLPGPFAITVVIPEIQKKNNS